MAEAEYHIKNIFPDKGLLRLLILADVLRDADLRTACLQRTASKITKFYKSPELGCELLRSMTLQELLSMCSNQQLIAIQQGLWGRGTDVNSFPPSASGSVRVQLRAKGPGC